MPLSQHTVTLFFCALQILFMNVCMYACIYCQTGIIDWAPQSCRESVLLALNKTDRT